MVIFAELLTVRVVMRSLISASPVYYCSRSVGSRMFARLLRFCRINIDVQRLDFGHVNYIPHVRKKAYDAAFALLDRFQFDGWTSKMTEVFAIDVALIVKKYLFDELYLKYEFYELVQRFAEENPGRRYLLYAKKQFAGPHQGRIKGIHRIIYLFQSARIEFISSLILSPLLLFYYRYRFGTRERLHYTDSIVCCVDDHSTYEMFRDIFTGYNNVYYVTEKHNARKIFRNELNQTVVPASLGLTGEGYAYLRKRIAPYIGICFRNHRYLAMYGTGMLWLFYTIIRGRAEAIYGSGNSFITFEHLTTVKAARNEFLRMEGSRSIFLSKNVYATSPYYHSETYINYDLVCSSGDHMSELYHKKRAITKHFLSTGSYDNHKAHKDTPGRKQRVDRLKAFKSDSIAITIISPGFTDATSKLEIKLMEFANRIAALKNLKVFIRLKPVDISSAQMDFYSSFTREYDNIMLTAGEYELFDFLEITDLFVTSTSTAACDIAMCGGQILFIDFTKMPDRFLFWSIVPGVFASEDVAFNRVMSWVDDRPGGTVRSEHKRSMDKLVGYIGYTFPDFDAYRANLLAQLQQHSLAGIEA